MVYLFILKLLIREILQSIYEFGRILLKYELRTSSSILKKIEKWKYKLLSLKKRRRRNFLFFIVYIQELLKEKGLHHFLLISVCFC